jgi:hypothetical protein
VAVELLAQLRPSGCVLDNFRFAMNGPLILDAELDLDQLLPPDPLKGFKLRYQYWPRDMASGDIF